MRKEARENVYKLLFEYSFNKKLNEKTEDMFCNSANLTEADVDYMRSTIRGAVEHYDELTELVSSHIIGYSSIDRIDKAVLIALMLGAYELKYSDVPTGAVFNEAINLAKTFGGESSVNFTNGVLAAINKDING